MKGEGEYYVAGGVRGELGEATEGQERSEARGGNIRVGVKQQCNKISYLVSVTSIEYNIKHRFCCPREDAYPNMGDTALKIDMLHISWLSRQYNMK